MNGAIEPERTHALVVAVEEYEDGDWNVPGPYADACAFISWLVDGCGVPDTNVTFFASPLASSLTKDDGTPLLPASILPKKADSAALPRYLQDGMADLEADLLWVFWSGHGLIDGSGSHVLLLADSSARTKRVVAVDAVQLALQSTQVGANEGQGVPKVAMAVNACQNQPREDRITRSDVVAEHNYVTERGLFVVHACSTGQRARVAPRDRLVEGEAAGLFPRALLRYLDDGSHRVLPDLQRVTNCVDKEFVRLREDGLTWQKPSLLRRNWDGETATTGEFQVSLTADEERLAALLDDLLPTDAARTACAERLAQHIPVVIPVSDRAKAPTAQQLVTSADRVPHGVPTLLDLLPTLPEARADSDMLRAAHEAGWRLRPNEFLTGREYDRLVHLLSAPGMPDPSVAALYERRLRHHVAAGDVTALLRSLEAAGCRTYRGSVPPLLRFASVLSAEAVTRAGRDFGLSKWSRRVAKRTGHAAVFADQMRTARWEAVRRRSAKAWLLVRLDVDDPEAATGLARYTPTAWLVDPVNHQPQALRCPSGTAPSTWRHTQLALAELIEPLIGMKRGGQDEAVDLGVEFFLPHSQLELQVERIPVCHRGVESVPLGSIVTVVVRCAQRRTAWNHRWNTCGEDRAPGSHHWIRQDASELAGLKAALERAPHAACIELVGKCAEFTPALAYCAEAGVPVMTWHRRVEGARPSGDLTELRTDVHPRDLPEEVRQLRGETDASPVHGRNHLVLLWDDPGRLPPRTRPHVPGRSLHP